SFRVGTAAGWTQVVTVTITGFNDAEETGYEAFACLAVRRVVFRSGGALTVSDADAGEAVFVAQSDVAGTNGYGEFSVDASGNWTYTTNSALDNLTDGQVVTDSFTVETADGTTQVVTVTITGTNDAAVIGGVATASVTETDAVLTTG